MTIDVEIDCLATARRILSGPVAVYSATPFEVVAMAACTVRESTGRAPDLPLIGDPPPEMLPASIAAGVANLIRAHDAMGRATDGSMTAFESAFNNLKTVFEKEFPNGSDQ